MLAFTGFQVQSSKQNLAILFGRKTWQIYIISHLHFKLDHFWGVFPNKVTKVHAPTHLSIPLLITFIILHLKLTYRPTSMNTSKSWRTLVSMHCYLTFNSFGPSSIHQINQRIGSHPYFTYNSFAKGLRFKFRTNKSTSATLFIKKK